MNAADNGATLLAALRQSAPYPHLVRRVELIETHISWVLLTGSYAYKVKKPVNLGFLDFTTLKARRRYCEEELRLNRRLAPELYLDVVPIAGTAQHPRVGGDGPPIEYAVKMKEFGQSALFDNALARGEVSIKTIETLARKIADFHARLPPQAPAAGSDVSAAVLAPAVENFDQIRPLLEAPADIAALNEIQAWTLREFKTNAARFAERQAQCCVRECHGDLHLGNIVLLDGAAVPFDGIEFNPALRWMDVMNEAAFLVMDLEAHGRRDLAYAFLSAYVEAGGDYAGMAQLPFYLVYRALVRAKVNRIRSLQNGLTPAQRQQATAEYQRYIERAAGYIREPRGAVIIMHGYSGSGKTTLTRELLASLGAVRVRSDVERKRLHGLNALARATAANGAGIYADDETARTYAQLLADANYIAGAGFPVIVDATFLRTAHRAAFHALALALGVPFAIVHMEATPAELRNRLATRAAGGTDASDATLQVLEAQIRNAEVLTGEELRDTVIATGSTAAAQRTLWDELAKRIAGPGNTPL